MGDSRASCATRWARATTTPFGPWLSSLEPGNPRHPNRVPGRRRAHDAVAFRGRGRSRPGRRRHNPAGRSAARNPPRRPESDSLRQARERPRLDWLANARTTTEGRAVRARVPAPSLVTDCGTGAARPDSLTDRVFGQVVLPLYRGSTQTGAGARKRPPFGPRGRASGRLSSPTATHG